MERTDVSKGAGKGGHDIPVPQSLVASERPVIARRTRRRREDLAAARKRIVVDRGGWRSH